MTGEATDKSCWTEVSTVHVTVPASAIVPITEHDTLVVLPCVAHSCVRVVLMEGGFLYFLLPFGFSR